MRAVGALLAMLVIASLLIGPGGLVVPFVAPTGREATDALLLQIRIPRTLAALLSGIALGAAGAVIQGLTRNRLADPGLLGVNSGAALALVAMVVWLGPLPAGARVVPVLAGAGLVSGAIVLLGLRAGTGLGLILGGAALAGMMGAGLRALVLLDPLVLEAWRRWIVGSVDRVAPDALWAGGALFLPGAVLAAMCLRQLDALATGDDMARALGTRVVRVRVHAMTAVALLSASAVIVAGPLLFVGLVAPQMARLRGAANHAEQTVLAALIGGALVVGADILGRVAIPGIAIPVGLSIALIGGPALIWQVSRRWAI
ncbi:FecCD family ABC transporter permease [Actibacterium ureilyticum]|uniref:FecCD family ABC transporter permease n=1 Tax=Actibacterium ureilyticum TaxID=1590614 RepID=UPI00159532E4|nr:iron ABC transporter permease [Actibacterium ureilyticum]